MNEEEIYGGDTARKFFKFSKRTAVSGLNLEVIRHLSIRIVSAGLSLPSRSKSNMSNIFRTLSRA